MNDARRSASADDDARLVDADRLLVGDSKVAPQPGQAVLFYERLARDGLAEAAARRAVLAALGLGCERNWGRAFDWATEAAILGSRGMRRQLAALAGRTDRLASGEVGAPAVWKRLRDELNIEAVLTPPAPKPVSESPRVWMVKGMATPAMAAWLMRGAQARLKPGEINDAATGEVRVHPMRTAMSAPYPLLERDLVLAVMQERVARATGAPVLNHEAPNVISYLPGQQFEPHYDFVDPTVSAFQMELMLLGQRVGTSVTYLNDGFEGGETDFPRLGFKFKGKVGDAILFHNVGPDGQPDPRTLHAGLPPTSGRKWVLSQWLRDRPQPVS